MCLLQGPAVWVGCEGCVCCRDQQCGWGVRDVFDAVWGVRDVFDTGTSSEDESDEEKLEQSKWLDASSPALLYIMVFSVFKY